MHSVGKRILVEPRNGQKWSEMVKKWSEMVKKWSESRSCRTEPKPRASGGVIARSRRGGGAARGVGARQVLDLGVRLRHADQAGMDGVPLKRVYGRGGGGGGGGNAVSTSSAVRAGGVIVVDLLDDGDEDPACKKNGNQAQDRIRASGTASRWPRRLARCNTPRLGGGGDTSVHRGRWTVILDALR